MQWAAIQHSTLNIQHFPSSSRREPPLPQQLPQRPPVSLGREPPQVIFHVDVISLRQQGHSLLRRGDTRQGLAQHGRRAPLHAGEDGRVERAGAAADEVVAAVGGGAEDPLAGLEEPEGVIDRGAGEARVIHADGHACAGAVEKEALGEGHGDAVAERGAGLHGRGVVAERARDALAVRGLGRRPEDLDLHPLARVADRRQEIAQHGLVHRQRLVVADGARQPRLDLAALGEAREDEQALGWGRDGREHGASILMPVTRIALLTDFGLRDPYVAAMKGVIASRCDARVEDLSHEIAPFDVWSGAFFLRSAVPYWPAGTIFVVVVDPGVGTSRRILAIERDGRTFLAPDNGVLGLVAGPPAVSVENDAFFLPDRSTTFHGRDRFAPVAAAIANGTPLHELGPRVDTIVTLDYEPPSYDCARAEGTIISIDRFGNLV